MPNSDDQAVKEIIDNYFKKTEKASRQQQQKLVKIAQIYGRQGYHKNYVHLIFAIFKKNLKKDTFVTTCKRFLTLLDDLLQMDWKKNIENGYRGCLSETIVEYYTFIFSLIFEYRTLDLIVDCKVYRMLWVKYINDQAFDALRSAILKSRNVDLNRGFTPEHMDAIKKNFIKKGMSEDQIARYLDTNRIQNKRATPSPSAQRRFHRSPSNQQMEDIKRKMVKIDPIYQPYPNMMINPQQISNESYKYTNNYPQNSYPMMQGAPYPNMNQNINQPHYQINNPNIMGLTSVPLGYNKYNRTFPPPPSLNVNHMPIHNMAYQPIQPIPTVQIAQNYYQQINPSQYGYQQNFTKPKQYVNLIQNTPRANKLSASSTPLLYNQYTSKYSSTFEPEYQAKYNQPSEPSLLPQSRSNNESFQKQEREQYKIILQNLKKGMSECKRCGLLFQSRQNLQKHQKDHFFEAQRKFQLKQIQLLNNTNGSQKQKYKLQGFDKLCDTKQWITDSFSKQYQTNFQVSINGLPERDRNVKRFYCFYCNEQMRVTWCQQLQEWSLEEGVKIEQATQGISVAHYDCYECFRPEESSFHTTSSF